jgi:hypothetical protein
MAAAQKFKQLEKALSRLPQIGMACYQIRWTLFEG